jgi:hypothetical protein
MVRKKETEKNTTKKKTTQKEFETGFLFTPDSNLDRATEVPKKKEISNLTQKEIISEPVVVYEKITKSKKGDTRSLNADISAKRETPGFIYSLPIYLQIHKGNVFSIFSSGIIAPARHIKNRAFPDIQSINETVLVVSNGYTGTLDHQQVLIEIILTDAEKKFAEVNGEYAILTTPVPVSRIQNIYVADAQTKKDIITMALSGDGGIIPENLFTAEFPQGLNQADYKASNKIFGKDYNNKLIRFDKILGAFAFIKNYSLALANQTDSISLLPKHFYYMAQAINNLKDFTEVNGNREILFYKALFGVEELNDRKELKWIFSRLNELHNFSNQDIEAFEGILLPNKYASEFTNKVKKFLKDLTNNLKRKQSLFDILNLPEQERFYLYLLGILRIYGSTTSEDKSISRRELPDIVKPSIGEYIYACLGYFYGYSALRNFDDKYNITDKNLAAFIPGINNLPLKFELNSLLDYAIIESVYQVVFHDNTALSDVSYLKSNSIKEDVLRKPDRLSNEYTFDYKKVLGKYVYTITKKSLLDDALAAASVLNDTTPVISDLGVYCWRNGVHRSYLNILEFFSGIDRLRYIVHFKKSDILEALKSKKLNAAEFIQRLELSNKFKEL